jgi:GTP cyclohydrolase III
MNLCRIGQVTLQHYLEWTSGMSPEILHTLQVVQQEAVDVDIRGHEQALHKTF